MTEDLEQELTRLTEALASAELEATRLQARIKGLRAERDDLAASLAAQRVSPAQPGGSEAPLQLDAIKKRTEAIEAILRHAGNAMAIDEVKDALDSAWREESSYQVVASTLNLLHRTGRIAKIARGRYVAA